MSSKKRSYNALTISTPAKSKKKAFVRKTKYHTPTRSIASIGLGFPAKLVQTLRYCENVTMTTGATLTRQHFSANGLYDPNTSGTGHQPAYFDQMSTFYNHYVVMGSRCKVTFAPANTSLASGFWIAGLLNDDTTAITGITFSTIAEQSSAKVINLSTNNSDNNTMVLNYSAKKTFGPGYLDQQNLQGTSAANPTVVQSVVPWFQLNPTEGSAAGQRYTAKGSPANDAIILEHTQFKFEFQNLGSVPVWCVLRCYKSMETQVGNLLDLQQQSWTSSIELPDVALVPPVAAAAATGILGVPNTASNIVPWTPVIAPGYNSGQHFNDAYKLARKYFFQIPSGGRVMFDISVKMNQLVNELDASGSSYCKGAVQWQLEHWGSQVLQTNPVESSVHAPSKIGIITTCHHTFRVPIQNKGMDGRTTINYQVQAQGATADEKYYDEDTGAIDTPLFAP